MSTTNEIFVVPALLRQYSQLPSALVEILAAKPDGGYVTLSGVLQSLTEEGIEQVLRAGALAQTDVATMTALSCFGVLMATHEGLVVMDTDNCSEFVRRFMLFLQAEALSRKGLVRMPYTALTMDFVDTNQFVLTSLGRQRYATIVTKTSPPSAA